MSITIRREIEVKRKGLPVVIDVTYGTDLIQMEFKVTDCIIPAESAAVAYNQGRTAEVHKQICIIDENVISFTPEKGFFEEGRNELQLRVVHNNRSLFTFKCRVECQGSFADSDAEEVKRNSSLVEQLMTEQAVTKARLEEVLKLPEDGSDVEKALNDIKVGADGKVYSSPGEAVRQQIGQVSEQIGNLTEIPLEVESTGFINDELNIISTAEWNITKPIKLIKGAAYSFKSINYTNVSAITECKEDGTLLETICLGLFIDDNTPTTVTFTPYQDMYVKLSYRNDYTPSFNSHIRVDELINGLNVTMENNYLIKANITKNIGNNRFNEVASSNGFLSSDGENVIPYEDWKTSDFIYVHDMKNVFVSADYNGSPNPLIMFYFTIYDADKNFIYQFNQMENPYEITDRVYYIRFSYHSNVTKIQVEDSTYATEYQPYHEFYVLENRKWTGKKWCVMGDSLTQHNERSRFCYHDYIVDSTGITVVNLGSSGKGYKNGGAEDAFYYRVRNIPTDSDVVTIFGSGNDLSHEIGNPTDTGTDTICGCINTTIDNLINRIPTVSLGIVTPTPWAEYPPTVPDNKMEQYSKALIEICKIRSIPYLDLYHESNLRPWTEEGRNACYSKDDGGGVHPDEHGHKLIAPRFKAFLEKLIL